MNVSAAMGVSCYRIRPVPAPIANWERHLTGKGQQRADCRTHLSVSRDCLVSDGAVWTRQWLQGHGRIRKMSVNCYIRLVPASFARGGRHLTGRWQQGADCGRIYPGISRDCSIRLALDGTAGNGLGCGSLARGMDGGRRSAFLPMDGAGGRALHKALLSLRRLVSNSKLPGSRIGSYI